MAKPTYWELLQHPKWQKRRLEVLSLSGFTCDQCGAADKMLHVHHSYYEKGLAPWEYPVESLHSLCEACHRQAQDRMVLLHRQIGRLSLPEIERLHGYALGLEADSFPHVVIDVFSYEVAVGIADCWRLSAEDVLASLQEGVIDGYRLEVLRGTRRGR